MSFRIADRTGSKRSRSRSPSSWARPEKFPRQPDGDRPAKDRSRKPRHNGSSGRYPRNMKEQTQLNQLQEDEKMREWVAQEDDFVLKQAKKKAEIRVKEGRAKPIDWLTITLRVIDPTRNPLDDEIADSELDLIDPDGVFEGLSPDQLRDLEASIDTFLTLEKHPKNRDFWKTMKIVCGDRRQKSQASGPEGRAMNSVADDINRLLSPKSYEELETLEVQIRRKLDSKDPIDTDYWEQLLRSLTVWKARAKLKKVYQAVIDGRISGLRKQQKEEAAAVQTKLAPLAPLSMPNHMMEPTDVVNKKEMMLELDPEPLLHIRPQDKSLEILDEEALLRKVAFDRRKILKMGFVPLRHRAMEKQPSLGTVSTVATSAAQFTSRFAAIPNEDFSQATKALYEREVARGVSENEEIFAGEEAVSTTAKPTWANKYRPRKPRYFNRVQMGYEWNKYNQTHYDYDNPPPKVVQAPTYKIERENGRKRGQSFAPAGEEDTCLIRFIAGPPYEDLAFRIVDKEWDYSAKRERGFKSSFDKGILQLHFQFKKIYYRK
ncbi:hypothetical protein ACJ72_00342 [Emergomyces africanus]|uniref:Splicing factor Cactin n=1 Tax=Emergomyces africanus TaxID=1955775 RepID=A0A1B7P8C2_9EURO|nr:hypothetical protein ACJ72_00342 [Emergomyces africanus]